MSVVRRITFALSAIWLSRLVAIALGLISMPILFRYMGREELGLWLLLSQSGTLILLMDLGITSTLTRRFAFISARAGAGIGEALPQASHEELADLMATARFFYRCIATVVCLGAIAIGWFFLGRLQFDSALATPVMTAWIIVCLAQSLALGSGLWTALGAGLGYVASVTTIGIFFNSLTVVGQIGIVMGGGGLVALAMVTAAGSLLTRIVSIRFVARRLPGLMTLKGLYQPSIGSDLIRTSGKYWLTELGALMLLKTDQYFIAAFSDLTKIPLYYAASTLVSNLATLTIAVGDAANVYVSHLWRDNEPGRVHGLVLRQMRIGLGLMLCGVALLIAFGESIMVVWLGPGQFIGLPILLTFCTMFTLHAHQSLMLGFSRATENEIYAGWYLAAGLVKLLLTWQLVQILGLWGVALATLLAQLPTTNWYILSSGLARLGISWRTYLTSVIVPALAVFLMACTAMFAASLWSAHATPLVRLIVGGSTGCLVLAVSFWAVALDPPHRQAVRRTGRDVFRQWLLRVR